MEIFLEPLSRTRDKAPLAGEAMPQTRLSDKERRRKHSERVAQWRCRLSEEQKAMTKERDCKRKRIQREMMKDRLASLEQRMAGLQRQAKRLRAEKCELKERVTELEKYELKYKNEPPVTDEDAHNVLLSYEYARKYPARFEALTGETPQSFDALYELLAEPLAARNYRGEPRKRRTKRKPRVSDKLQLYITLLFLRQYPTYAVMLLALRGLDELTIHHYIHRVLRAIESVESLQIKSPSEDEFKELLKKQENWPFARLRKVVCAVDGTEIRVARPSKGAIKNKHYSGKKKQYAINVLIVVRLDGVIIYCSAPQAKMNDQACWLETELRSRFVNKPYGIIADGGFTFNYQDKTRSLPDIIAFTLHKRPRRTKANPERGRLTGEQKRENVELSKTRVVVENTIHRLKIYKILGTKLRHYWPGNDTLEDKGISPVLIVRVVAMLTNRAIHCNPIRSMNWVPENVTDEDLLSEDESDEEVDNDDVVVNDGK